jgi:hypothetical protein
MAIENINVGTSANDGNGDPIRDAFIKCNDNFDELETTKISGSGTDDYIPKFNGTDAIENSQIFDNGTFIGIGTSSGVGSDFFSIFYNSSTGRNQAINIKDTNASANGSIFSVYRKSDDTYLGAISRNGSSDALFVYGNDHLALGSSATERMRITSSGNVGIGTTSPTTGNLVIAPTTASANVEGISVLFHPDGNITRERIKIWINNFNGQLDLKDSGEVKKVQINSNGNSYFNGGNVGIGTTNPSSLLHISKNGEATLRISNTATPTETYVGSDGIGSYIAGSSNVVLYSGGFNERMRITSSGNVGIGTTNPGDLLTLFKSSYPVMQISSGIVTGNMGIDTSSNFMSFGTSTNHDVSFATNNTPRMRITSSGNVGIGTSTPDASAILHLRSNSKGFLPPTMTTGERDSIGSPADGLIIYNTDTQTINVFTNSGGWKSLLYI